MNHRTADTSDDEEEEEEEEEEEVFHESLDRIASSSSRSCSNSDDEPDESVSDPKFQALRAPGVPRFSAGLPKYDVWVSQPSSVSERRSRLLQEMGLSPELGPSQMIPGAGSGRGDYDRSVSSCQLGFAGNDGICGISRSKSDNNSVKTSPGSFCLLNSSRKNCRNSDRCDRSSCSCSNSFISLENSLCSYVNSADCEGDARLGHHMKMGSEIASANLGPKPPTKKYSKRLDGCNSDGTVSAGGLNTVSDLAVVNDGVCTIKDLDNGKEFVVNEIKEDAIKEVGTGRQLTLEEFQMTVGHSPIVQELLRRQNVDKSNCENPSLSGGGSIANGSKSRKRNGWFKSMRSVANAVASSHKERRSSDEKDSSSEKGGRRSSSATEDSQDGSFQGPERVKVRQYGKSTKELTAIYKSQEIHAHNGPIWSIKFSLDGRYLASAGEDCVIHVWKVVDSDKRGELLNEKPENGSFNLLVVATGSPEVNVLSRNGDKDNYLERKRSGRLSMSRKSVSWDHTFVPETVFALSEKPVRSFEGHLDHVLDLSWSNSQHLLSSSMDKTVRLWHLSSNSCLKVFSHNDYVTCIQFNPIDDRYFISGSLDAKVRIWSIHDRQVIDWNDIHEMVTAACYTPDGQGALAGSYNGICHLYDTSDNKLLLKSQINLQYKKKKSQIKKITGFQFAPGSSSEVLITSADSRIRVVDGDDLVHKFTGFRNTNSQISASFSASGKYVVSASEDSAVYVWSHEADSRPSRSKGVTITHSYEYFHCQDVSAAIPWPGIADAWGLHGTFSLSEQNAATKGDIDEKSTVKHPPTPIEKTHNGPLHGTLSSATNNYFLKRISGTWPEEKLTPAGNIHNRRVSMDLSNGTNNKNASAWGLVIITAGLGGEIRVYQNFGVPFRI